MKYAGAMRAYINARSHKIHTRIKRAKGGHDFTVIECRNNKSKKSLSPFIVM